MSDQSAPTIPIGCVLLPTLTTFISQYHLPVLGAIVEWKLFQLAPDEVAVKLPLLKVDWVVE